MKIAHIIREGGWETTVTQGTVLHPKIVGLALQVIDKFVIDFNAWLSTKNLP
jgi:pyruvate-formate lyase-activating enzyme